MKPQWNGFWRARLSDFVIGISVGDLFLFVAGNTKRIQCNEQKTESRRERRRGNRFAIPAKQTQRLRERKRGREGGRI